MLEETALLFIEGGWDAHGDVDVVVAAAAAVEELHALAAQTEDLTGLRARRNLQRLFAVDRLRSHFRAESGLRHRHALLTVNVIVAARELRMRFDGDEDVEIARRSAVVAGLPFSGDTQTRTVIDAGRNLHGDLFLFAHTARAITRHARLFDHFARTTALRTRPGHSEESL